MAYPNDVEVLFKKGKKAAAAFIHSECVNSPSEHKMLLSICDALFDPRKPISDWDTIDWIRWIIAGGKNPDEFAKDGNDIASGDIFCKCCLFSSEEI